MKLERREDGEFVNVATEDLCAQSWTNLFSPHGWHVQVGRDAEWVMDSTGKKLLWLPLSWRMNWWFDVRWNGNFLAFVDRNLPDPIIIEVQQ